MQPGAIIGEAWDLYKRHWQHFVPIALVVFVAVSLVSLLLAATLGVFGVVLGGLVSIVGVFWLQGALVEAVADVRDGRADLTIAETLRRVQPRLLTLLGAGILAGLGVALGFVALIVPGLILLTWWSLLVPAIVLEGRSVTQAFGRSRELVRGNGWNVFGVIVLTLVILIAAAIVMSLALFWLPDSFQSYVENVISNTVVSPFIAIAWTLMYYALGRRGTEPADTAAA